MRGTVPLATAELSTLKRCEVVVKKGAQKGQRAKLDDGALVIGSGPEADLRLEDSTVSGRHCELVARGEQVVVRDLGSRNGVLLDGVRVIEAVVEKGSELTLGTSVLVVEPGDAEVLVSRTSSFGPLFGHSPAMRAVFAQLQSLADSNAPVLVEGETGTGKDVTAEALHQASGRADAPFVVFDCGAVAASLVEAELFGHEKGAFTGAEGARDGLAAAADGGTLVLDEIGELPLELQPKLLRLVEKGEVRRVGSTKSARFDVRIIACTNRSLKVEVAAGRFREDLYFRLSALRVRLPSLRERPDDIPGLVDHLFASTGARLRFEQLGENDRALLLAHRWPGNVRELRNTVERLRTFPTSAVGSLIETDDAAAPATTGLQPLSVARQEATDAFEVAYVRRVLAQAGGSVTEGAKLAGVSRQFLQRLIKKHGLR
jgi:DNA-binding NtrC family response regulator